MENPGSRTVEVAGPVDDPPAAPPVPAPQDQSTSDSLADSGSGVSRPPPPLSPLTGCYLLIIVGEPHSERHKEIILQKIAKVDEIVEKKKMAKVKTANEG
ncbi:hypothetical protein RUM44_005983 [Polyplax serrata]|uniref:Uncharacterized protein n=1 Tax=Polyplax serrata TaxID=468196 RepID=A0ABR1AYL7_POLSC